MSRLDREALAMMQQKAGGHEKASVPRSANISASLCPPWQRPTHGFRPQSRESVAWSPDAKSAIYIRFTDLQERNDWLSHARNLAGKDSPVSISPDIPPVLRQLKKDLLAQRKDLDLNERRQAGIYFLKQWPFMKLKIKNKPDRLPRISQRVVVEEILGFNPTMEFTD